MIAGRFIWVGLIACVVATSGAPSGLQAPPAHSESALLVDQAFAAAYNLDYAEAAALARRAVAANPNEPATHRGLATMLWLDILFRRGAITVDHYLGGVSKSLGSLPKPPADLDAEFHRELDLATRQAEARLARAPLDLEAHYAVGSAYALQASYSAAVEGSVFTAFRFAKRAYDAEESVLARDPHHAEAAIAVGIYRYIVSALSMPSRWMAYIVGFGGGKEKGIALIESALNDPEAHVDASVALVLIYSREARHDDAVRILRLLEAEFPRNRLFVLEEGASLLRAGHAADAEAALTRGFGQFERDPRPRAPGEHSLWLYKRGSARVAARRPNEAEADLRTALDNRPVDWVRGRIHLELGKVADLRGERASALTEYRQARIIADANSDPLCSADAARLQRRPFSLAGRKP
jgi:tetratricopeptide (TPR) repeat protein